MSDTLTAEISALQSDVVAETSVNQSAVTLLQGLSSQLKTALAQAQAAGATPAQLSALNTVSTSLQSNTASLAAAVAANTPAASSGSGASGSSTVSGGTGQ